MALTLENGRHVYSWAWCWMGSLSTATLEMVQPVLEAELYMCLCICTLWFLRAEGRQFPAVMLSHVSSTADFDPDAKALLFQSVLRR